MPKLTFHPPPPMPQRSIPPRIHTIIPAPDITGDIPSPPVYPITAILAWYKKPYVPQQQLVRIAPLVPIDITADVPPLANVSIVSSIIANARYKKVNLPVQKVNLTPQLIGAPEDTIPPLAGQAYVNFNTILYHWTARDVLLAQFRQKSVFLRTEITNPPSLFIGRLLAFQPNAFQIGYPGKPAFQGFNRAVKIREITVDPLLLIKLYTENAKMARTYRKGSSVVLRCQIYDPSVVPAFLTDPDAVFITILNPDETVLVDQREMSRISLGHFTYIHQTLVLDQSGAYTFNTQVSSGSNSDKTLDQVGFILVP